MLFKNTNVYVDNVEMECLLHLKSDLIMECYLDTGHSKCLKNLVKGAIISWMSFLATSWNNIFWTSEFTRWNLCRYQFNPAYFQTQVTSQILLKALTNLPHTDFTLCKCMIDQTHVSFCCLFHLTSVQLELCLHVNTENVWCRTACIHSVFVTLFHAVKLRFG